MPGKFNISRIGLLDSESRKKLLDPEAFPSLLPLVPSSIVADIGCGTGFFTIPLAKRLPQGRVFAVDVLEEMLERVKQRVQEAGLGNVETVRSTELDVPLPGGSLDGILVAFVLHEIEERRLFLERLKDLLKERGWLALMEWVKKETPAGPPVGDRIDSTEARELLEEAGFQVEEEKGIGESFYFVLAHRHNKAGVEKPGDRC